jgi:beta-lactamase regulating signal transducer with metallopeptidase domain
MSVFIESVVSGLAESVSPVLIHSLWQGLLIAFLLKATLTIIGDQKARLRYVLATSALATVVVLCLITGLGAALENSGAILAGKDATPADNSAAVLPSGSADHAVTRLAEPDNAAFLLTPEQIDRWLIPFWICGILLLTLRHAVGYRRARTLARCGTSSVPAVWTQRFERICRDLKMSRPVRFLGSSIVKVPCVVGWIKPVILFPLSSLAGLAVSDVEMILAHELAHVRRNDVLVNIGQIVVETLLFFNPAVWWISRQMRIEREHCCDDLAIAVSGDRLDYARALVNLEDTRRAAPEFAVAATATGIVARVRRIVLNQAPRTQSANMGVIGMLLLAALLIVGVTALGGPATSDVSAATTFQSSGTFEPSRDDIKGDWEIETNGKWSQVTIRFKRNWTSGFSVKTSELLSDIDETTTHFQMRRDAGTFHFEGKFDRDKDELWGEGECYFRPNPDYVAKMGTLGYDLDSDEDVFELAVHDVTLAYVQGLHDAGYDDLSRNKLVEAHIHDVTPEYISGLAAFGYKDLNIDKLIEMNIHDVDPEYVQGLADLGHTDLPADRLVEMRIHDVDPEYIGELADLGYTELEPSRLVEMQIHDVTPDYVEGLAKLGYTELSPAKLVEMQIHDVDADYIGGLAELGYTDLEPSRLVEMHIHDVTPAYVEGLAKLGYTDLSPARLVEMQIHDVDADYIGGLAELGYTDLQPSRLVEMHIHDVDADYISDLQELGYKDLSPSRLVEMQIHDVRPSYIEELAKLGYKDISPAKLVEMQIHDVTSRYIEQLAELGYDDLSPSKLVEMKIHDVTPSFIKRMQKREGADLTPRDLIEYKIHGRY